MIIGTFAFLFSWLLRQNYIISGLTLIIFGVVLYLYYKEKYSDIVNTLALFSGVWFVTIGMSCFKLHPLQHEWQGTTWFIYCMTYIVFNIAYELRYKYIKNIGFSIKNRIKLSPVKLICGYSTIVLFAFIFDYLYSGFIPAFSSSMSAYVDFGAPFIHYITVSCVVVLPLTMYFFFTEHISKTHKFIIILFNIFVDFIPLLIVSRQLLLLELVLAVSVFYYCKKPSLKITVLIIVGVIFLYYLSSLLRNQSDDYFSYVYKLNTANVSLPVKLWQIYTYLSFNFDNFDAMVNHVHKFSFGLETLNPLFTFTGTRDLLRAIVNPLEKNSFALGFNAWPFIAWPYQDWGQLGVYFYTAIISFFCADVEIKSKKMPTLSVVLTNTIMKYCVIFSFFSCFFCNVSIWGDLIAIWVLSFFVQDNTYDNSIYTEDINES